MSQMEKAFRFTRPGRLIFYSDIFRHPDCPVKQGEIIPGALWPLGFARRRQVRADGDSIMVRKSTSPYS